MTEGPSRPALLKEIEKLKAELAASVRPAERVVYRDVPGPERVVEVEVERVREVPVEVERVVYVDNPAHLETIRALQAQIASMQ